MDFSDSLHVFVNVECVRLLGEGIEFKALLNAFFVLPEKQTLSRASEYTMRLIQYTFGVDELNPDFRPKPQLSEPGR